MAHKKTHGAPVPPGNRRKTGPDGQADAPAKPGKGEVASNQESDPKHRLGDFEQRADHSIQEPDGKNGSDL